jgi:multidrug transporter EmrE-like cation transporter
MIAPTMTAGSVALFLFLIVSQIIATSLLPRTVGFTDLQWTIACLGVYAVSLWSLAHIIHKGMPLSLVVPILAAVVPLASIAVAVVFYKEAASLFKIVLLCSACGVIGLASGIK